MIIGAIDPGMDGAVAVWMPGLGLVVHDTPTIKIGGTRSNRRDYNEGEMADILRNFASLECRFLLEKVGPRPHDGSVQAFTFGGGVGLWRGILAAFQIPYDYATPQQWRAAIGLPNGSAKGASRLKASQLYPAYASLFQRVRDDGRAEAVLMADFLRRRMGLA